MGQVTKDMVHIDSFHNEGKELNHTKVKRIEEFDTPKKK